MVGWMVGYASIVALMISFLKLSLTRPIYGSFNTTLFIVALSSAFSCILRSSFSMTILNVLSTMLSGYPLLIGNAEQHDKTLLQERALQAFLLRAYESKHPTKDVYNRIRPVGSTRPRTYGVPNIHKADIPLRPILSMINSPQHELAKWLTEILQPVVNKYSTFTVKDTFEFCEKLEEFSDSWVNISETSCVHSTLRVYLRMYRWKKLSISA